jgi:hypothetical protein
MTFRAPASQTAGTMVTKSRFLTGAWLALVSIQALGTDIVACIVADVPDNSSYYGMATTLTRLRCEFTNRDYYPTLPELYHQGWRLIQVLGGDQALVQGSRGPSPLYLLEREAPPGGGADSPISASGGASPPASGSERGSVSPATRSQTPSK